jgi:hypothetical protein
MKIDPGAMTGLLGPWPIYAERDRQGKSNVLLFPQVTEARCDKAVECREGLGGLSRVTTTEPPRELLPPMGTGQGRRWASGLDLGRTRHWQITHRRNAPRTIE